MEALAVLVVAAVVVFWVPFHARHYRAHRRAGLTVRESIPGPFRTWVTVSRRIRPGHLILGAAILVGAVFAAGLILGGAR